MNTIPESERMALDFDGWLGSQEEGLKTQITGWLNNIPETDRPLQKDRLASQFIVAEAEKLPISEVVANWDMARGGFAAKKGSEWFGGVNDDAQFHAKMKSEMQFRREERQILSGPDDDKAEGAAEKSKSALVSKMSDAAFTGAPFAESFAGWQEAVRNSPGWRADRSTAHEMAAREVYDKTAAVVAKVKPVADEAFNRIAAYREVANDGSAPDAAPFAMFRGMTQEEKAAAFRIIKSKAAAGDSKDPFDAFFERAGVGFENLAMGFGSNLQQTIAAKRFKEGDEVTGSSAVESLAGKESDTTRSLRMMAAGGGVRGIIAGLSTPKQTLTAEKAAEWNAELDAAREDFETMKTLRKIGTNEISNTSNTGGYVFQKMILPVSDSAAIIAGLSNPGTAAATLYASAGMYTDEEYMRLRGLGMEPAEAVQSSEAVGATKAVLDKLGFEFLRGVPVVNRVLNKFALGGGVLARGAANTTGTLIGETAIEIAQDHVVPALMQDLFTSNPKFDVNWSDVWSDAAKAAPEIALGMILLSSAGGAYQTFSDTQATRMLSESKAAMTLAGYTDAQIDLIQQQPIAERGRLLAEFAPDKAPTGAEKDALIERYANAATAERDAAIAKIKAETGDASDALDYAVRVTRRQGSGWTVTTESGKSLVVDTAEAARRIRQDLAQASSAAEAETLVKLVDEWHGADTNADRETTFTGERATSDGRSITYKRGVETVREITDAQSLETLRREAEIAASQTDNGPINVVVNGSNVTFQRRIADAAYQVVQRLEINRSSSSVLTFLHESMESNWRAGMQNGTLTREATQRAVASIAGAFNLNSNDAETKAFAERVKRVADGVAGNDELRETVSELATADVIGRRKNGGKVEVGSISRAISDAIQRAADESTIAGLTKLQGFIRAAKAFFRGVLGTVAAIRKAKQKNGKLAEDWEAFMHKITGTSAQTEYDAGRVEDLNAQLAAANAASDTYVPPNAEQEAAGIAFSASRAKPADTAGAIVAKDGTVLVGPTTFSISAYHGTPHKIDPKEGFKMDRIGTGEGAQAYGHGLYFAEAKAVGEEYRTQLAKGVEVDGKQARRMPLAVAATGRDVAETALSSAFRIEDDNAAIADRAIADIKASARSERWQNNDAQQRFAEAVSLIEEWKAAGKIKALSGNLYTVELDVEPDELLDWDKPLSEQSEKVKKALAEIGIGNQGAYGPIDRNGAALYMLATFRDDGTVSPEEASSKLNKLGILGIRYLDGASRGDGKGTSNFVMFDESRIKITAENEQVIEGRTFSVSPARDAEYLAAVERGDMAEAQRMVDEAAKAAGYDIFSIREAAGLYKHYSDKAKKSENPDDYDALENFGYKYLEQSIKAGLPETVASQMLSDVAFGLSEADAVRDALEALPVSIKPVTRDESGNVIPLSQRFNEASNDIRFSVSPTAHVELLQRQVDAQLARDPDRRRGFGKAAKDKLESLEFNWTTDRVNARGVKTRALVEQRSPRSLTKEQAFREALRREELEANVYAANADVLDNASLAQLWSAGPVMEYLANPTDKLHGRLMSKSAAVNSGKLGEKNGDYDGIDGVPRVVFGGSLMPDQVAQELFEAGVLKDASADTLWDAIRSEVKSAERWKKFVADAKEDLKQAKRQAREEMAEWRREQDELQAEDWNPKARLLRDMRALDAVLSVLPPELRAKVGGFIKLAELTTDKARMKEIEKRIKKLGGLVEDYLQKENVEALERLIEKATPATGAGEKPKGKIGVEGHRVFTAVEAVRGMTTEQVDAERARLATAIEDRIAKGEDMIDLLEQEQILEMFGAFDEKTAAEMDRAVTWLDSVYRTGKNAWRMAEEMRLEELKALKAETIKAVGIASKSGTQEQKANATKLKNLAESVSLNLLSFTQVLESVVGEGHPLVKRWSKAARDATNQRTDAILAANARFETRAREAMGGVTRLEMSKRLWTMANDFTISLPVVEGGGSNALKVPIAKVRQFIDGTVNPVDLGYSAEEAKDLIDQLNALPEGSRKKNLTIERVSVGKVGPAKYTEAQVLALTMLGMQEQYLPNLKAHGYTADVIEAAEASLSDAAKAIRSHLLKEYKDGYAPLAKVFREMFGIDLPSVANYSPAAFMHAGETRDVDPFGGMVAEGGFRAGFLKSRKEHLAAPRIENAFQTYQGHVAQTEHWRAFAPLVRELRGVFGSVEVKDSILSNRGQGLAGAAQGWITALEQNGLQQRAFMSALNPIFRYLTGRQATLTLAWKAGTLIKQSLAALSSAARLPTGAWLRGLSRVMSGKVDLAAIRNSPMIQRRLESGFSPEVRAAMVSLFNGKPSAWSQFIQSGMEKIGEVDAFFTSIGTAIAYDYHYNEGLKSGMSEEAAREMALVEAEDNLGRTAQPTEMMDRSLYELGMSPAERVGFMFASNQRKDTALLISAYSQWKRGEITTAQLGQTVAVAWVAIGFGSALLGAMWRDARDDDDDEWLDSDNWSPVDLTKQVLLGPLAGIPLANMAVNSLSGYGPNDPFKPVKQAKSAVAKIDEGDKAEPVEKTVRRAVDAVNGAAILVPKLEAVAVGANILEQVFDLVDNFTPDTESEATKKEKAALAKERKQMKAEK